MGHAVAAPHLHNPESLASSYQRSIEKFSLPQVKKKILFVTPEFTGLVKAGGLADVSAALPRALAPQHDIRVLIPGYRELLECGRPIDIIGRIDSYAALPACDVGRMELESGQIIYVLLCKEIYAREGTPYTDSEGKDWSDNHIRFARLGLAAAEIAAGVPGLNWQPDLVHAHDWPAAMAPAYMAWRGQSTPSVFTIHNLAYQGLFSADCLPELGLPAHALSLDSMEFYGKLSFIKAGIAHAGHVTTVSETYAREITTTDFGCGLEGLLKCKWEQGLLSGITNGIDESWQPTSDPHLVKGFSSRQWHGRQANARYVERLFNLPQTGGPLFAVISRLVQQKGIDLTLAIADAIVAAGGRIAVMGCGESDLEAALRDLARRHPEAVGVHLGFNETDARRLYAGSDFLLMPSRFEPCGLSQMYAQRFGSLPIARRTGGLADTIEDGLNGFLFDEATTESYLQAVKRALNVFHHPNLMNAMRCRAMAAPCYWQESVQPYDQVYRRLINETAGTAAHRISKRREA